MSDRFVSQPHNGGGHLVGYVRCSYAELVSIFGEPNKSDEYKVSTEWDIVDTQTNHTLHLYDYKETRLYNDDLPTVEQFRALPAYDWHIGGYTNQVDLEALSRFLTEKLGREIKAEKSG